MIRKIGFWAIMLIATVAFVACGSDDEKTEQRSLTVSVASELVNRGTGSMTRLCMDITVEETGEKLYLLPGEILGFNYEEGYKYRLKIKEMHVKNETGADSEVYYVLDVILSEERDPEVPIDPITPVG